MFFSLIQHLSCSFSTINLKNLFNISNYQNYCWSKMLWAIKKMNRIFTGNNNSSNVEFNLNAQSRQAALLKQLNLPANLFGNLAFRRPCECDNGICGCCTGMLFSALRQMGCMNITYHPDDFSFEFKMIMNNAVLYKNRVTGRNPPPVCVRVPRLNFIRMCASFYDLHFIGRNMHVCLEMSAYFQENEVFNRYF